MTKFLLLTGHGIDARVDRAKLQIKDGRSSAGEEPRTYTFSPQRIDVDNIIIYGRNGNLTLEAIRWLIKHGVMITILNWDGKLLTAMLPSDSVQVQTKFAQYRAFENPDKRLKIAKAFIDAKFMRTRLVLDYLHQRYPIIDSDFSRESSGLDDVMTIHGLMGIEGAVAEFYWQELQKIIPSKLEFSSRIIGRTHRPIGASDWVNCMLNYGYALLEAECIRAIHSAGLDPHVGFLHEMQSGKYSLAYDLQEPFRFLVDLAVLHLIETDAMEKKDFIRTESFTLRLRPSGARKVTDAVNSWLNKSVKYQGKDVGWDYVLFLKTRELAHYLVGKKKRFDIKEPGYRLDRADSEEMRKKILDIPYSEWKKRGFSKGTLHYLKKNARGEKQFKIRGRVFARLK